MKWFLILAIVAFGLWLSLYFCLFGGIVAIINAAYAGWPAVDTAFGIVRFLCTGFATWLWVACAGFVWVALD